MKISKKYKPTSNEKFMNKKMREYFRLKLISWKKNLLEDSSNTINNLQESENLNKPDMADRASLETDKSIELRARDRERKLISKIDSALKRIENGTYGFCEESGEPINVKRLDARPIATLSIEEQEKHERMERIKKS